MNSTVMDNPTQFFLIDSLGSELSFPEGFKRLLLQGGQVTVQRSLGEKESRLSSASTDAFPAITHILQPQFREHEVRFYDDPGIVQQSDGWSCGNLAIYNTFMLLQTGSNAFLWQFLYKDQKSRERFAQGLDFYLKPFSSSNEIVQKQKRKDTDTGKEIVIATPSAQLINLSLFAPPRYAAPSLNKVVWREQLLRIKEQIEAVPIEAAKQQLESLDKKFREETESAIQESLKNARQLEKLDKLREIQANYWMTLQNNHHLGFALVISQLHKLIDEMLEESQSYSKEWEYQGEIAVNNVVSFLHYYQQHLPKSFERPELKNITQGVLQLQNKMGNYDPVQFFIQTLQRKLGAYWLAATLLETGMIEEKELWSHIFHLIRSPFFALPVAGGVAAVTTEALPVVFSHILEGIEVVTEGLLLLFLQTSHFLGERFTHGLEKLLLKKYYLSPHDQMQNLIHCFNHVQESQEQTMGIATTLGHRYANVLQQLSKADALRFAEFNARLCLDYFKTGLYLGDEESKAYYERITAWVVYEASHHENKKWLKTKVNYRNKEYPIHELISKTGCYVCYVGDEKQEYVHYFDITATSAKSGKIERQTDGETMGYCAASGPQVLDYIRYLQSKVHPDIQPNEGSNHHSKYIYQYQYQDDGSLVEKCRADKRILGLLRPVHSSWRAPSERLERVEYAVWEIKSRLEGVVERAENRLKKIEGTPPPEIKGETYPAIEGAEKPQVLSLISLEKEITVLKGKVVEVEVNVERKIISLTKKLKVAIEQNANFEDRIAALEKRLNLSPQAQLGTNSSSLFTPPLPSQPTPPQGANPGTTSDNSGTMEDKNCSP